ncbi:lamin tail domain-containing protein [Streptomyces sp. NPDC006335]|uniref:lamin tail domain-containing protein n=1 Tax=Streptomyces sp. NPDC006335 TaxID=3156895 RepID=UPI00339DAF6D
MEISAVQYESPGRGDGSRRLLKKEWVELTNTSRRAVNLGGWTLAASSTTPPGAGTATAAAATTADPVSCTRGTR